MSRLRPVVGLIAVLFLIAALVVRLAVLRSETAALGLAVTGVAFLLLYLFSSGSDIQRFLQQRSTREGGGVFGTTVFLLGTLVLVNVLAARLHLTRDVTSDGLFTLAPETISVFETAPETPEVYVFHRQGSPAQQNLTGLLEAAKLSVPRIRYEVVDPDRDPSRALQFQLDRYAAVAKVGEQEVIFDGFDEEALVTAVQRASKTEKPVIGFLRGHGEAFPGDQGPEGLFDASTLLHRRGYRAFDIDLIRSPETLMDSTRVLVIAGPKSPPTPEETDLLVDFFMSGGRCLVLLDPAYPVDLEPLLSRAGIVFDPRFIEDPDERDPQVLVPRDLSGHPVVADLRNGRVSPVLRGAGELSRYTVEDAVARNAVLVWTGSEARPAGDETAIEKRRGLVAAAERLVEGTDAVSRMVVIGDRDFATNAMYNSLGNSSLFLSSILWLVEEQGLVSITPRARTNRPVVITRQQGRALMVLLVGLLPVAVMAVGGIVWWRRR